MYNNIINIVFCFVVIANLYSLINSFNELYFLSNKCQTKNEIKLYNRLRNYCKSINLKVYIEGDIGIDIDPKAAGQIKYYTIGGLYKSSPQEYIVLSKKHSNAPWVLGHEIGHYLQLNEELQSDENGADYYADQICRKFLNKREQHILRFGLECHYGEGKQNYINRIKLKNLNLKI